MAKRPAEYRLSPAATRDLESIWLYTLERWGLEQATRYTDEFVAVFNELAENPALGTPADHIRKTSLLRIGAKQPRTAANAQSAPGIR